MNLQRVYIRAGIAAAAIAAATAFIVLTPSSGSRTLRQFDPDRMADLELRIWQAYYAKENVRSFGLLTTMLREQYHYSWLTAAREGFHLARAASRFSNSTGGYDAVLPDLEAAYTRARDWLHADFDPREVARAELAWWVARRTPGADSVAAVGWLIADQYALLYGMPRDRLENAGFLRAQAAALRDEESVQPDWVRIGELLNQSYRELLAVVNALNARDASYSGTFLMTRSLCSLPPRLRT